MSEKIQMCEQINMSDHIKNETGFDVVDDAGNGKHIHIGQLGLTGELSAGLNILGGLGGLINMAIGIEGRVSIKITNKLKDDLEIQLHGGNNQQTKEVLKSGMTRIFSKRPKDGFKTTKYECEFWYANKHARVFVYGEKAPRKDNLFEVREEGFFLIDQTNELHVSIWDETQS